MLFLLLQRVEARRPAVLLSSRRLAVLLSLPDPRVFQIPHPLVDVADVGENVWVAALLETLQRLEDDILVDLKNMRRRHVGQGVHEVHEGCEAGVGSEQNEDVAVPQMFPECLQEVEEARPCLKQRKDTIRQPILSKQIY
jgi:hypothetical protein